MERIYFFQNNHNPTNLLIFSSIQNNDDNNNIENLHKQIFFSAIKKIYYDVTKLLHGLINFSEYNYHQQNYDFVIENFVFHNLNNSNNFININDYNIFQKKKFCDLENSEKNNNQCSICLDEYKNNDLVTILKCKHFFHDSCIKKWLLYKSKFCPICRRSCNNI